MVSALGVIVLPKTETISRLKENFEITDIKLSDDEIKEIKGLDKGYRTIKTT